MSTPVWTFYAPHEARHAQRPPQAKQDKEDTLSVDQIELLKIVHEAEHKRFEDVRV